MNAMLIENDLVSYSHYREHDGRYSNSDPYDSINGCPMEDVLNTGPDCSNSCNSKCK